MDGKPTADAAEYTYHVYNGNEFECMSGKNEEIKEAATVEYTKIENPDFDSPYFYELDMIKERAKIWYDVKVTGEGGFVCINYVGDAAQLYADGELVADEYYYGNEWVVPSKLLCGRKVTLGISELDESSVYLEVEPKETLVLNKIYTTN